jgi:LuxR family maltose regulon positive regulatory protein
VGAAAGIGAGDGAVGAAGQRQDRAAAVLDHLPTHLSAPEIAGELSVSTSTVKTHLRNLYAKLGVHSRAEAVESARNLGLLAPSARSR